LVVELDEAFVEVELFEELVLAFVDEEVEILEELVVAFVDDVDEMITEDTVAVEPL
jgi:hypothetical protein